MLIKIRYLCLLITLLTLRAQLAGQAKQEKFTFQVLPGTAWIIPSQISILQEGYDDLHFQARYKVDAFSLPVYYSIRAGVRLNEKNMLEMELNHLKVYLRENPPEIDYFSISHGYNQLWFNISGEFYTGFLHVGLGPVIAHPENSIRGMKYNEHGGPGGRGYHLAGISTQVAWEYRLNLLKNLDLCFEGKYSWSYSQTGIYNGHSQQVIHGLHALAGLGLNL